MGGVGREAQMGEYLVEHELRFKVNLEWSMLFLCRWKEGWTVGKAEKREDCIGFEPRCLPARLSEGQSSFLPDVNDGLSDTPP